MVHHIIPFAEKNLKKRNVHAGTNDIYSYIDTIGTTKKYIIMWKQMPIKQKLIFEKLFAGGVEKESWTKWKH